MFVFTPLILNSANALRTFLQAPSKVLLFAVTFTNIESKKGEIIAPWYTLPASNRIPNPDALL